MPAKRCWTISPGLPDPLRPAAIVLVTHHVEEIPTGFSNALVLRAGRIVAGGPIEDVLTDDVLSRAFDMPIRVTQSDGRSWARMGR